MTHEPANSDSSERPSVRPFPDALLTPSERRISTRQLVLVNDALATMKVIKNGFVHEHELVQYTLAQVATLLDAPIVEQWSYDWESLTIRPTASQIDRHFYRAAAPGHPASDGIPTPRSLVDANARPRRRTRTYISRFDEQPDVTGALFEYYRRFSACDRFVHFPLVSNDQIVGAICAMVHPDWHRDGPMLELAHALVNRSMTNLETMDATRKLVQRRERSHFDRSIAAVEAQRDLLTRVSASLSNGSGTMTFIQEILREACEQLNSGGGYLSKFDEHSRQHHSVYEAVRNGNAFEVVAAERRWTTDQCPVWATLRRDLRPMAVDLTKTPASDESPFLEWHRQVGHRIVVIAPMLMVRHAIGTLSLGSESNDFGSKHNLEIQHALAQHAAMAIRLTELSEETHDVAVQGERTRIARDIHDNLAQFFTGIAVQCEAAMESSLKTQAPSDEYLQRIAQMAREGIKQARQTIEVLSTVERSIGTVHDVILRALRRFCEGTAIHYETDFANEVERLTEQTLREIQSIVTEAISNVVKHSRAKNVLVRTIIRGGRLSVSIEDDGVGMKETMNNSGHTGRGIENMKYRALLIGAELRIDAERGSGTCISLSFR
ncbi:MAG: histidine kinase [Planctomycetota bacterium]